ncbi:RHG27 protein, partial [Crypturellus soui]|nr:RHG27 protein [Crypturellus soui]
PKQPPEPVYLNVTELREEAAAATSRAVPGHASPATWEAHTDTSSGRVFYYNPLTGASTWECPVEEAEDGVSPAASPAASPAHSTGAATAWGRYVDEASGQAFFYNSVTGETSWDPPNPGTTSSCLDMSAGVAPRGAAEQRPPTPETDYPELSPDELEAYADDNYSPLGFSEAGASPYLLPRPAGWCGPEGAMFCTEHYATDTV